MTEPRDESPFGPSSLPAGQTKRRRWSYQLSLTSVLLIMTVVSIALAPLAYLVQALRGSQSSHFIFLMLCLATPALALVLVSLAVRAVGWLNDRRQ